MGTDTTNTEAIDELCAERGIPPEALLAYCDNMHITENLEEQIDDFLNCYRGEYDSFLDFATELFDDTQEVPDHLSSYINYKAWARDIQHDYWENKGFIFRNC